MRIRATITLLSILLLLCVSAGIQAQPQQEHQKQIEDLKQQIAALKADLNLLKAAIKPNTNGTLTITNTTSRADVVGAQFNLTVGGTSTESVGGASSSTIGTNQTEMVGATSTITIGTNKSENIGQNLTATIGNGYTVAVGAGYQINTGRDFTVTANEQIVFKCGTATLILRKNGDIELKGNVILPATARDILIRGTKLQ
jgi:type VI secretion system secreted protein VgrG